MPVYGKRMEKYAPAPTEDVKTIEKRFVFPKITVVQIILIAIIIAYVYRARKMNGMVVGALALAVALLHMYDHIFLLKRGPERSIRFPINHERYEMASNMLRRSLKRATEGYTCQACK
jgi:hypothetical protein